MNALTIFIIIVAVASLIFGYHRGIVREASSLCAILLAIVACQLLGDTATTIAAKAIGADEGESAAASYSASIIGCGSLFILVWLGVYLLARMLRGAVRAVRLGIIDSAAGALFSCGKWMLALSLVLNLVYLVAPTLPMWGGKPSGIVGAVLGFAPWIFGILRGAAG